MPELSETNITLFAAIAFSVVGIGTFLHFFLMVLMWPRANGIIVANCVKPGTIKAHNDAYFPVVEFIAADGKKYQINGDIGLRKEWPIGQKMLLCYRSSNPGHATIMKSWQRMLFSMVFIAFAVASWYAWFGMT